MSGPTPVRSGALSAVLRSMRPKQWLKNLLVLAAPVFGSRLLDDGVPLQTALAFGAFCLAASGVYLVNDAVDVELDRAHPQKHVRPVAAGQLPVRSAYLAGAALLVASLAVSALSNRDLVLVVGAYVGLSLLYCFWLKDEPVIDITIVASGFLLRAVAGGAASSIYLSQWFLLAASFGSLFMASGKRYAETRTPDAVNGLTRPTLVRYSSSYLRFVWTLSASVLIMTYGMWAFELRAENDSVLPVISMAPFVLAVLRYAVVVDAGRAETPEEIALTDRMLQLLSLTWAVLVVLTVYT